MSHDQEHQGTTAIDPQTKGVIAPICPHCKTDPLNLKRLRYDFPDGVMVETIFCANLECRAVIAAQIVGIERPKTHSQPSS